MNKLAFCFFALLAVVAAADVCDKYVSLSGSANDSFCQNQACRQYCAKGSDVEACMKAVYEGNFKLCKSTAVELPTPAPTTTTTKPTPQPTPAPTAAPTCSEWSGHVTAYNDYCRGTACPACAGYATAELRDACVEFEETWCSTSGLVVADPAVCLSWTSKSADIAYCQTIACPQCETNIGEMRERCLESQQQYCNIPSVGPTPSPPTPAPTAGPSPVGFLRRVVYFDWKIGTDIQQAIKSSIDEGYNTIVLGFWIHRHTDGTQDKYYDAANLWMGLTHEARKESLHYVHAHGSKILVSVGGATENHSEFANSGTPTGPDYGRMCAEKAIEMEVDGLDFDSEHWSSWDFGGEVATKWLIEATRTARQILGDNAIISHAPQAPYFSTAWAGNGGYGKIHKEVGSMIDYYFIQFYNQGAASYHNYETLIETAGGWAGNSAVKEIIAQGIPQEKIVVGKFTGQNGSDGKMEPGTLKEVLCQAQREFGFDGGMGVWQYDNTVMEETFAFARTFATGC